jgi:hypothetical protein
MENINKWRVKIYWRRVIKFLYHYMVKISLRKRRMRMNLITSPRDFNAKISIKKLLSFISK